MNQTQFDHSTCHEIVALLNELLDGECDAEREARAKELIAKNPQCHALYFTMLKTIELYRERKKEMTRQNRPIIKWLDIEMDKRDTD